MTQQRLEDLEDVAKAVAGKRARHQLRGARQWYYRLYNETFEREYEMALFELRRDDASRELVPA